MPIIEDRVRYRRSVLEGGHQVRRQIAGSDNNRVMQARVHRVRHWNVDGRRRGGPDLVHRRADSDLAELAGRRARSRGVIRTTLDRYAH